MKIIYHILTLVLAMLLGNCSSNDMVPGKVRSASGRFMLSLLTEDITTEDITRNSAFNLDVDKFKVSITDAKGLELISDKEYGSMEDNDMVLPAAEGYLIEVANCTPEEAIKANGNWGTIRFMASETFDIVSEETTPLILECSMENAGLMVLFDESFTNKFPVHAATTQDNRSLVFKNDTSDKVAYYNISQNQEIVCLRLTGGSAGKWEDRIDKTENITINKGKITKLKISFRENDGGLNVDINTDTSRNDDIDGEITI